MRRRALLCVLAVPALLALPAPHALASGCSLARTISGRNPSYAAVARELDRAAARRKVPPPLLKAIAWRESGWAQFWPDGRAKVSADCGIGIMQITGGFWDYRRLAGDYVYNIDAGALVLAAKMTASSRNVPSWLGTDDRRVGENWYRAAYRYNGAGWRAERYADAVFALAADPPSGIRPWTPPVRFTNPKSVIPGYHPASGASYVARPDGTWVSTLGRYRRAVTRADWLAVDGRAAPGGTLETDQRTRSAYFARNVGWEPWTSSRVSLGTWPVGRASRLRDPSWISASRVRALATTVPPGGVARWDVVLRAAPVGASMTTWEGFAPVVDGWLGLGAGRSGGSWTLHPARAPSVAVTAAPEYASDTAVDNAVPLSLSYADPAPGSGVAYVDVATRACATCEWTAAARVTTAAPRIRLHTAGRHEIRARAVDRAGHPSAWTDPVAVVVPRDNAHPELVFTGDWTVAAQNGAWFGAHATAPIGATVETTFAGSSYAVIGARGPAYAPLSIYLDGRLVGVVEPLADVTIQRQVLFEGVTEPGEHTLLVVVGVPDRKAATAEAAVGYLDALAVT